MITKCSNQKEGTESNANARDKSLLLPSHLDVYAHDGEGTLNLSGLHEALLQ